MAIRTALHILILKFDDLLVHVEFGYAQCSHIVEPDDVRKRRCYEHVIVRPDVFENVH